MRLNMLRFTALVFELPLPTFYDPWHQIPENVRLVGQNSTQDQGQDSGQERQMLAPGISRYGEGHLVELSDVMRVPWHPETRVRAGQR